MNVQINVAKNNQEL